MKAYSLDLRKRIVEARQRGMTFQAIADEFGVSTNWARKLLRKFEETGSLDPRAVGGDRRSKLQPCHFDAICDMVQQQPGATLDQLRILIRNELGIELSLMGVSRALKKLDLHYERTLFGQNGRRVRRDQSKQ